MKNPQGRYKRKNILFILLFALLMLPVMSVISVQAFSDEELSTMKSVLIDHSELFKKNDIVMSAFRQVGWGITKFLAGLASSAADLFDTCFGFVDFTTWPVMSFYIKKYRTVWGAVLSLSLLATGIILMVWNEKRPKIFVNIMLAVFVISCSTFMISEMNKFLNTDVRKEILGTSNSGGVVYETLGTCVHDLVYLDLKYGLKNLDQKTSDGMEKARATYDKMTESQMKEIDITQILKPDLVTSDSRFLSEYELIAYPSNVADEEDFSDAIKVGDSTYVAVELYDGVAWTDAFNTYYYRYTVDYLSAILMMLSLVIVYLFMSFKVIKTIYENVITEIVAIVQSANITQNQKTIKCLQALRDGYIVLLITLVTIKVYLMASKYVSTTMPGGQDYKGWIMIFIAFAVIEGPAVITRLTGMEAGSSDGMGKIMSAYYGFSAAAGMTRMVTGLTRKAAGGVINAGSKIIGASSKNANKENMEALKKATSKAAEGEGKGKVPPESGSTKMSDTGQNDTMKGTDNNGSPGKENKEGANVPPKDGKAENKDDKNKASSDIKGREDKGKNPDNRGKIPPEDAKAGERKNPSKMGDTTKGENKSNSIKSMQNMKKDLSGSGGQMKINEENSNKPLGASGSSFHIENSSNSAEVMKDMSRTIDRSENHEKKEK